MWAICINDYKGFEKGCLYETKTRDEYILIDMPKTNIMHMCYSTVFDLHFMYISEYRNIRIDEILL